MHVQSLRGKKQRKSDACKVMYLFCLGEKVHSFFSSFLSHPAGGAVLVFCRGTLRPGFELVADLLHLDDALRDADLCITGEGRLG